MKTDIQKRKLIGDLKKTKVAIWKRIASELEKSTRRMPSVNLYKINKYVREGETAVVPGKVLATGNLNKKLTIAAFQFSDAALEKINKTGKAILLDEALKQNIKKPRIIK
jgi:large subunit ribosomal protein L18e